MRTSKRSTGRRRAVVPGLAIAILGLCAGVLASQESPSLPPPAIPPTATPPPPAAEVPVGESPVLIVDMRPQGDIQTDLNDARALKPRAEADEQRANAALIQSKATLAIKKSERESLDDRTDAAKKTGNEAEAATLDREREESDLRVKLEERFVGVREIQLELARARKAFADRSVAALEAELEMAKKVENWDAVTRSSVSAASAPEIVGLQVAIRGDERRVLKAMKERADQAEEVAKKDRELVESQLRVLESDTAILDFATRAR